MAESQRCLHRRSIQGSWKALLNLLRALLASAWLSFWTMMARSRLLSRTPTEHTCQIR